MSKNQKSDRKPLCGNCKFFVAGGKCQKVKGEIKSNAICNLHRFGKPNPIDTTTNPEHTKEQTDYEVLQIREATTGDIAQKAIQMEHDLLARGIPENEAHRAVMEYFSQREPPYAMPFPGPVTGIDNMAPISPIKVVASREPLTNFEGLPQDVQPYPTATVNPYPNNPTPDPNSLGSLSNTYNILTPPYPFESSNWTGLASDVNSEPSMHGEHGFNVQKAIPEWRYPIEQSQVHPLYIPDVVIPPSGTISEAKKEKDDKLKKLLLKWAILLGGLLGINKILKDYEDLDTDKPIEVIAEYQYNSHDKDDQCYPFNKKRFNLLETHNRPIVPSEGLGYTTNHPNCKCTWKVIHTPSKKVDSLTRIEQSHINDVESHIDDVAKKGELHTVKKDGTLVDTPRSTSPILEVYLKKMPEINLGFPKNFDSLRERQRLRESINSLRSEFKWLTEDYIDNAKKLADESGGVLYLIRAAAESITDHRGEGEPYRRKLAAEELNAMTRTAIGKEMDINHQPEYKTDSTVLDAEFDKDRKEMQLLVIEKDNQINDAIDDRKITAVSINGGMPRSEKIEPCDGNCTDNCELCLVPQGVVLGELDNSALTWVITDPNGMYWDGHFIPKAEPGIKITMIERL